MMTQTNKHSGTLKAYVVFVVLAALAMLALFPATGLKENIGTFLTLLVLVLLLGTRPVRIRSLRIQVAALDLFILSALLMLDPMTAPLVALIGVVTAVFGPGRRPLSLRTAFNLGMVPLSASLGAVTYVRMVGGSTEPVTQDLLPLIVASAVYFLANTILAAIAIAMESRSNLFSVWFGFSPSNGVSTLASMVMAIGLAVLVGSFGSAVLLIGLIISIPILAQGQLRELREQPGPIAEIT